MKNIIIVHRPTLTAEEREARMKQIADAAAKLIVATAKGGKKV